MSFSHDLCQADDSLLVLIDIQTRLSAAMPQASRTQVIKNAGVLAQAASNLGIDLVITRQYPRGLGDTEPEIPAQAARIIDKTAFSCFRADSFPQILEQSARHQIILAGMESHVCVLQTAFDLRAEGYQVFVVEDAVCSRSDSNHRNAMRRMAQRGITITNTESTLFEWLREADHPQFKQISALIK
ncbi:MAG TPA: hydrolase [Gammaproteobacteria bacterium]|nr:hydrolase [Gammaproteobacteria bacterium]